jgi:hypothetical protein
VRVGVKEEEENHAESHEVHVDEKKDAAVVEAPAALHATDSVGGAGDGGERGEDEDRSRMDLWKAGEEDGCCEPGEHEKTTANKRARMRIEKTGEHARS